MSDRIRGFVVTLTEDITQEQADRIESALRLLPKVASVAKAESDYASQMAEERVRQDIWLQLLRLAFPVVHEKKAADER